VNPQEVIQASLDAANRDDLDAVAELVHDDFIGTVPASMSAEPDTYEGRPGIQRYFQLWHEIVDGLAITAERYEQAGDWTIAVCEVTGTGRSSGLPLQDEVAIATLLRDGLIFRMEAFPSAEEARAAVEER
jgi:ketosteroid isomerase-like protein